MNTFAVFGNPIEHSRSPEIHTHFFSETGIFGTYDRILASKENFELELKRFFNNGGFGANITVPFKKRAFFCCNSLTEQARISGTVNTIKKQSDGSLLGDNTDGIGLISDLKYLNFIKKEDKILLIGAGGAAYGVISSFSNFKCQIFITNRTFSRAQKLSDRFIKIIKVNSISFNDLLKINYDLIINATSSGIDGKIPEISERIITKNVKCYDMFYTNKEETPFISWCKQHGAKYYSDGLGMLVRQASYSFLFWHGVLPKVLPILSIFRSKNYIKNIL